MSDCFDMSAFKRFIHACTFSICLLQIKAQSQGNSSFFTPAPTLNDSRLIPVLASEGVLYAGSMAGLWTIWYKNYPHSSFHFFNDNGEWQQMDKFGHALSCYTISRLASDLYQWTGIHKSPSDVYGSLLGFTYQTNIEVFDGFSSQWGFSLGDALANTTGMALFAAEEAGWGDQRIIMKISFHPTEYAAYRPDELGSNLAQEWLKDYNGQTYWFAFALASFLPKSTKLPGWLCLDFGYGAEGMTGAAVNPPSFDDNGNEIDFDRYRKFFCSVDVDLTKIQQKPGPIKALCGAVSFIKIPAPTLEFSRGKFRFHYLYF
jgi:hypothetical protein